MDIALVPDAQGRGLGTCLIRDVMGEAAERRLDVTLHVERWNPAWRLYERMGFLEEADRGVHVLLRWTPGPS